MDQKPTNGFAYLTHQHTPIPAQYKQRPEDFIVTEIPLEQPADTGNYLYLFVQKTKRLTSDITRILAEHFSVPRSAVGYAGLKDKHAIARQWFSIENATETRAVEFKDDHIQIIDIRRHHEKLQRGKLTGNHFQIKLRGIGPEKLIPITQIINQLAKSGAPNFIGEQRFGYRQDNHLLGRDLVLNNTQQFLDRFLGNPLDSEPALNQAARTAYQNKDYDRALHLWPTVHRFERQALGPLSRGAPPQDAANGIDLTHRTFLISAFQSHIFNQLLDQRLRSNTLNTLQPGDVAMQHADRNLIEIDQPAQHQSQADSIQLSPTGPMWGHAMKQAKHEIAQQELNALQQTNVTTQHLADCPDMLEGSRRPLRMPITDPQTRAGADEHGPYVELRFQLPRGSYATVLLREIIKPTTIEN